MSVDLLKIPPLIIYEIATDIQVSEKWKKFAFAVGFSTENVVMLEMTNGDRFPAENVMYHWFSKNPKVEDLGKILCELDLEKPLHRLENFLGPEKFEKLTKTLKKNRSSYINPESDLQFYTQNSSSIPFQTQLSNTSTASSSTTTPEAGLINIEPHLPSIPRSSLLIDPPTVKESLETNKSEEITSEFSTFETILKNKSTKFSVDEFNEENFIERFIEGKFSGYFRKKLRGNTFNIQSFSLQKISKSKKNQKKLYNILWSLTNFRLYSLPIISGYCFLENYLFIIYPDHTMKSLFDILHRPHIKNHGIISSKERLRILRVVGETLSFLHCSIPFGACHGHINSHNVLVGSDVILLSGFERFYTEDTEYLKGLADFSKPDINIEDYYRRDIQDYLELICETWWNIQPYKKDTEDESLLDDIKRNLTFPKVRYPGWNEEVHGEIHNIIASYKLQSGEFPKIEEIVDDLIHTTLSLEPPSYTEIDHADLTNCF